MPILNAAFYKFVALAELSSLRAELRSRCRSLGLKGTILLSAEGINANLAADEPALRGFLAELQARREIGPLEIKESWSEKQPFLRMFVKLKKEIIPMGRPDIRPAEFTGLRVSPRELKRWLDEGRDVVLVDTRNEYEIEHGTFEGAVRMGLKHFREFGAKLEELPSSLREKPVVMFCTGGIRCEKATALAMQKEFGFKEVYQLEGGILRYFEECGGSHYRGSCFVFDERVALDPALKSSA